MMITPILLLAHMLLDDPSRKARTWPTAQESVQTATPRQMMMDDVKSMDRSGGAIFNEDVTASIAPYFPPGQSLKTTVAMVQRLDLGELEPFKGKTSPEDGTLFVSSFSLTDQVIAVLHFSFRKGSDDRLVIDHARAFLRSQGM